MNKRRLTDEQLELIKLVDRSQKSNNDPTDPWSGWAPATRATKVLVDRMEPELVIVRETASHARYVAYCKLTEEGQTLVKWL